MDVRLRSATPGGSTEENDVPEDYQGVGDGESTMVLTGNHFQFNLDTDGFEAGTLGDPILFYRAHVTVEYSSEPGIVVGEEDALLESK